jgi:MFS family permease
MQLLEPAVIPESADRAPWWRELNRYEWFVFAVAALGWVFDTLDQQLFILGRKPAITELLQVEPNDPRVEVYSGYATSLFILGWAVGGMLFGILGDRFGRARVMLFTILGYSLCTGLSAISLTVWDYSIWRFLTGMGIGGEFAVGVALVAEIMPERARPHALGWLQALAIVGKFGAAAITFALGMAESRQLLGASPWRVMFLIGALPALLVLLVRARLKEPQRWQSEVGRGNKGQPAGSMKELLQDPRWRRHALVGLVMASAGVVGLWTTGFASIDFVRVLFRKTYEAEGLTSAEVNGKLTQLAAYTSLMITLGGFCGVHAFTRVTQQVGRRPAFLGAFLLASATGAGTYWFLNDIADIFWMIPLMGFSQIMLWGGYTIYLPELFPTRLRCTGTAFCFNAGRFLAAVGPFVMGVLVKDIFSVSAAPTHEALVRAWRLSGLTMSLTFLLGALVLPFAPETKGQPLPA